MKSFVYVYRESALSVLTPKQLQKVKSQQGQFEDWRVLHVGEIVPGEFHDKAALVAEVDNDKYQLVKSEEFLDYDVLSGVLDFGQTLGMVA